MKKSRKVVLDEMNAISECIDEMVLINIEDNIVALTEIVDEINFRTLLSERLKEIDFLIFCRTGKYPV